jgi:hypothetical protein
MPLPARRHDSLPAASNPVDQRILLISCGALWSIIVLIGVAFLIL